jgi:hypothetical protein
MNRLLLTTAICSVLAAWVPTSVNAQVFNYTFKDTSAANVTIKPPQTFVNPQGPLTVNLISGLDRYERVTVLRGADRGEVFSTTTSLVTVSDRLVSSDGTEYYGKSVLLPVLSDGTYTIVNDTLDTKKNVVSTSNTSFTIDTSAPSYKSLFPSQDAGYSMVLNGSEWGLGRGGAGQFSIFADGLEDASGIREARMKIKRADGSLVSDTAMNYDISAKRAYFIWAKDRNTQKGMPSSDLDEVFTFNVSVTDNAGNILNIPPQNFLYDDQAGEYTLFAIHDSNSKTSNVPGIASGYAPYKKGMMVSENPYRVVIRFPKTNYFEFRKGGLTVANSYGNTGTIATDSNYVYVELKLPQGRLDMNYVRLANTYEWGGVDLSYELADLVWDPNSLKSPIWAGPSIERQAADGTWFNSQQWKIIPSSKLPMTVTNVRYTVEPRPYEQRITGAPTCIIPVGASSCTAASVRTFSKGTTGYLHDGHAITSTIESTFNTPTWENIAWMDLPPKITGYDYNEQTNTLSVYINQPYDGAYFNQVYVSRAWLSNLITGKDLSIIGTQIDRNLATGNSVYTFNLKTLPEGLYDIKMNVMDNYGNTGAAPFKKLTVDNTAPSINATYEGKPITADVTVFGLENISINLKDALTVPRLTRVTLSGGPNSDLVDLSWIDKGNGTYVLNYPVIFPSTQDSSGYTLSIKATDEMNNSSTSVIKFNYMPKNLIQLERMTTFAVNTALKTSTNEPLAVIRASLLRTEEGAIARGVQTGKLAVRKDAAYPITIAGVTANPGETKDITIDLGVGDGVVIPVFPGKSNVTGVSAFIINFPQLQ